jgi:hypothetical protein
MTPEKLRELADRIDHEQLWRLAMLERPNLSADQRDRLDAGVELRRWATAKRPWRWVIISPEGSTQFSASTLQRVAGMAESYRPSHVEVPPRIEIDDELVDTIAKLSSLAANEPEYNEAECFVFEHALQLGFEMVDDDGDVLACTLGQLLALLRARGGAV